MEALVARALRDLLHVVNRADAMPGVMNGVPALVQIASGQQQQAVWPDRLALKNGAADFVTFTSSSTVDNFVKIMGLSNIKHLSKKTKFASIGPVTSKTLRKYGLVARCEAKSFTIDGLIDSMVKTI